MTIRAQAADPAAFAPFGEFVAAPARHGDRRPYSAWLAPIAGLAPSFHTNLVPAASVPVHVVRMERHPHAAQVFLPLVGERYLVVVAPSAADGGPDASGARAFVVPATLGVAYRRGVWHAGITALDGPASFAVLMWRGAADDDEFTDVAPWIIDVPALVPATVGGGVHV